MVAIVAGALAGVIHVLFFLLESFLFTKPLGRKVFQASEADAQTMKFLAFNQGFYNLFLAIGCFVGVYFLATGKPETGRPLVGLACACMVGAACVLATGGAKFLRGVTMQGLPPLVALVGLFL